MTIEAPTENLTPRKSLSKPPVEIEIAIGGEVPLNLPRRYKWYADTLEIRLRPKCSLSEWAVLTMIFHHTITQGRLVLEASSKGVHKSWAYTPLRETIRGVSYPIHPGTDLSAPTGRKALEGLLEKGLITQRNSHSTPDKSYFSITAFDFYTSWWYPADVQVEGRPKLDPPAKLPDKWDGMLPAHLQRADSPPPPHEGWDSSDDQGWLDEARLREMGAESDNICN